MDNAAVTLAILAGVLFLALVVQFFGWLRVRLDLRMLEKDSKAAIAAMEAGEKRLATRLEAWDADERKPMLSQMAKALSESERAHLRLDSVVESFSQLNAKINARAKEDKKRAEQTEIFQGEPAAIPQENPPAPAAPSGRLFLRRKQG